MEEIAKILKKLRPENGRWQSIPEIKADIEKLTEDVNEWIDPGMTENEVEELFDSIIRIWG